MTLSLAMKSLPLKTVKCSRTPRHWTCMRAGVARAQVSPGGPQSEQADLVTFCYCCDMLREGPHDYAVGSPTRMALDCLTHKWTVLIILALKAGPLRFTRLREAVPGITSQVLTLSL